MSPDDHITPPAPGPRASAPHPGTSLVHVPEDPRVDDALRQLRALLLPGETLDAYAVQRRLFALVQPRLVVAATSGRLLSLQRRLFGGYGVTDVRWQDLRDASLRAGTFGADITIVALTNEDVAPVEGSGATMTFAGLRKEQAQDVYRICQAQEQAWREKRRVRDLDELRARSGGIQLGGAGAPAGAAGGTAADEPTTRLRRAKEMLDGGLITDAEYESIKARIIDGL